jgi:hypothetical protein
MFVYEILSGRAAVIWRAQWLLFLALGIGFVEILESSALIAVWTWGHHHGANQCA